MLCAYPLTPMCSQPEGEQEAPWTLQVQHGSINYFSCLQRWGKG